MTNWITLTSATLINMSAFTQDTAKVSPLTLGAFVEVYYSYDFNKPADDRRPAFLYSHNRHNEFNVNLAYLKVSYTTDRTRANLAIAAGTYVNANYASEPVALRNIYEADLGLKISKTKNLWVDAGVLPSHIGFESAHSPDCWILTRSIIADNSPYYEAGAKVSYASDNNKWMVAVLALNGWQRIQRLEGNSLVSWGTQVQFKPSERATLNYSTFFGTDKPDSARVLRQFHNLYAILELTNNWGLIIGFDLGKEQKAKKSSDWNTWYGSAVILRCALARSWALALRGEYYDDRNGVIISTRTVNGFKTLGTSVNVDKAITGNFLWRNEVRMFRSKDNIFAKGVNLVDYNTAVTTSIAITF